jgi:hypothetical protein
LFYEFETAYAILNPNLPLDPPELSDYFQFYRMVDCWEGKKAAGNYLKESYAKHKI